MTGASVDGLIRVHKGMSKGVARNAWVKVWIELWDVFHFPFLWVGGTRGRAEAVPRGRLTPLIYT